MRLLTQLLLLCLALVLRNNAPAQEFVEPAKPAKSRVAGITVGPPPNTNGRVQVPIITWGGDAATLLANGGTETAPASLFGKAGLNLSLTRQDDFVVQVKDYMEGRSPFLRGTLGMINTYTEALNADSRTAPVVVMQLTWSTGGDCLVVRDGIASPKDLKGKTVVIQQYGPHVEYMDQILRDAGLSWKDVTIRWCEELYDVDGKPNDPATLFRVVPGIHAAFCISPDAAALTSNMTVGTGAEDSVRGARVLMTTKTASRVIADVYAVRSDFLKANREWVKKFVAAHFAAQQQVVDTLKRKESAEYAAVMTLAADKLLDNPQAIPDAEGLLADCSFALAGGNADYFDNSGNLVGFEPSTRRNQSWLVTQGFLSATQPLTHAGWAFAEFGVVGTATPAVRFNQAAAVQAAKETQQDGILFEFEILFEPNQKEFKEAQYGDQFRRALELSATYGGALLEIVGHSDPTKYMRMKEQKLTSQVLERQRQAGLNLSDQRASEVRKSLIDFAKGKNISINETQFISTGRGYDEPKIAAPTTKEQMAENRRVQFRIINIEGEAGEVLEE
jgi:outer membrane protein OmpA-like peptidoglycan-associated protein